jgi:hypothetical protein
MAYDHQAAQEQRSRTSEREECKTFDWEKRRGDCEDARSAGQGKRSTRARVDTVAPHPWIAAPVRTSLRVSRTARALDQWPQKCMFTKQAITRLLTTELTGSG